MVHFNKVCIGNFSWCLCREVSWNAEGGSKCKICHFHGSASFHSESDAVSNRLCDCIVDGLNYQLYSRMDKKRTYADVVSGTGKFIGFFFLNNLSSFFSWFGNFSPLHIHLYFSPGPVPTPMKDWWSCNYVTFSTLIVHVQGENNSMKIPLRGVYRTKSIAVFWEISKRRFALLNYLLSWWVY